jgi:hypothetical protein
VQAVAVDVIVNFVDGKGMPMVRLLKKEIDLCFSLLQSNGQIPGNGLYRG